MFMLFYVELVSYFFLYFFNWVDVMYDICIVDINQMDGDVLCMLDIFNYKFNLQCEIKGLMDYINKILLLFGKKVEVFFWIGNCVLLFEVIVQIYLDGFFNMNGGDIMIIRSCNIWIDIVVQGVCKQGWYQVFVFNQDENVYIGNWIGFFYGFECVIESYELIGELVCFKVVDIYYYFYVGIKFVLVVVLYKIYCWVEVQLFMWLYVLQYICKVIDFENISIVCIVDGMLVYCIGVYLCMLCILVDVFDVDLFQFGIVGIVLGLSGCYLIILVGEVCICQCSSSE